MAAARFRQTLRPIRIIHRYSSCSSRRCIATAPPARRYYSGGSSSGRLPINFLSHLATRHPNLDISTNVYDLDIHGRGESHHPSRPPDAVIRPTNVDQIRDILMACCSLVEKKNIEEVGHGEDGDDGDDFPIVEVVSVIPYGAGEDGFGVHEYWGMLSVRFPSSRLDVKYISSHK